MNQINPSRLSRAALLRSRVLLVQSCGRWIFSGPASCFRCPFTWNPHEGSVAPV